MFIIVITPYYFLTVSGLYTLWFLRLGLLQVFFV
jgi:hypothetical protein